MRSRVAAQTLVHDLNEGWWGVRLFCLHTLTKFAANRQPAFHRQQRSQGMNGTHRWAAATLAMAGLAGLARLCDNHCVWVTDVCSEQVAVLCKILQFMVKEHFRQLKVEGMSYTTPPTPPKLTCSLVLPSYPFLMSGSKESWNICFGLRRALLLFNILSGTCSSNWY